ARRRVSRRPRLPDRRRHVCGAERGRRRHSCSCAGFEPLDGIVRPTFGAYTLAVTLLLPFVAIRLIANERQSGAMELLLQAPVSRTQIVLSKLIVLKVAWIVAMVPAFLALLQWRLIGGHLHAAE